jgi:hypothetical protein
MDVCLRFSVLCCPVYVETLRWTDPPPKESYQMCNGSKKLKLKQDGEALSKPYAPCGAKEELIIIIIITTTIITITTTTTESYVDVHLEKFP